MRPPGVAFDQCSDTAVPDRFVFSGNLKTVINARGFKREDVCSKFLTLISVIFSTSQLGRLFQLAVGLNIAASRFLSAAVVAFLISGCSPDAAKTTTRDLSLTAIASHSSPASDFAGSELLFERIARRTAKFYGRIIGHIEFVPVSKVRRQNPCDLTPSPVAIWINADTFSSSEGWSIDEIQLFAKSCDHIKRREIALYGASERFTEAQSHPLQDRKRFELATRRLLDRIRTERL